MEQGLLNCTAKSEVSQETLLEETLVALVRNWTYHRKLLEAVNVAYTEPLQEYIAKFCTYDPSGKDSRTEWSGSGMDYGGDIDICFGAADFCRVDFGKQTRESLLVRCYNRLNAAYAGGVAKFISDLSVRDNYLAERKKILEACTSAILCIADKVKIQILYEDYIDILTKCSELSLPGYICSHTKGQSGGSSQGRAFYSDTLRYSETLTPLRFAITVHCLKCEGTKKNEWGWGEWRQPVLSC